MLLHAKNGDYTFENGLCGALIFQLAMDLTHGIHVGSIWQT